MFQSIHRVTSEGVEAFVTVERSKWVLEWPGMVILLASLLFWTKDAEVALENSSLKAFTQQTAQQLMDIVDLVRGKLTALQRMTLGALVVMDVHARDVASVCPFRGLARSCDACSGLVMPPEVF